MIHALLARTKGLFDGASHGDETGGTTDPDPPSTSLYSCPDCGRTYITQSMEACSKCGEAVERVPDETELGLIEG